MPPLPPVSPCDALWSRGIENVECFRNNIHELFGLSTAAQLKRRDWKHPGRRRDVFSLYFRGSKMNCCWTGAASLTEERVGDATPKHIEHPRL